VYNLQFLDVFPGFHQISIAAQEDMYQILLLFPIGGDIKSAIELCPNKIFGLS
jgi:hypothetical protein